jgi:glycosyltransferase involved in cell wall biosynthesis
VHSFDAPLNVFGVPTARVAGAPVVISSQRAYRNLVSPGMRLLLRATDHIADAIVVNCQAMKHHLLYDEHVPESKIHVCYNGIDTERYQRKTTLSDSATPVIGVVSALRPEKGIDILLKAFASLHELEAKLLIVGSGPEESKLRAISADLGITSTCTFQPATSDVVNWLSQIDIFVLPSRSEALSNSLMEAMCCACCPIASRVGGNPELIDDGSTGLLFEVDDVEGLASLLREAVTTAMLRERLSEAASAKIVARFSKQQASATMERIYQTVLKTKT